MKRIPSHRGSALLIVLGMLSFMIISAVGFAAYMRYSRQPSSFLRRTTSTRHLVKAGLAEAMDTIDRAINNNPYPGVGTATSSKSPTLYNGWHHRVFTGLNTALTTTDSDTNTANPLCLEALAYIPPPLVNEARYFSRFVQSTKWQSLGFDSGRYSWLALDVSDYFDINRLMADKPRNSSPARRISLAYLFENTKHTGQSENPAQWDEFMKTFRGDPDENTLTFKQIKSKEPLISVGDFSLALGAKGEVAGFSSPFYDYLTRGSSAGGFYGTSSEADEERLRRMTFLTDSLLPASAAETHQTPNGDTIRDLNDSQYQPFKIDLLHQPGRTTLASFVPDVGATMQDAQEWVKHLSGLGCAILFDYLDTDHYPISLAIPTTERVPMVCGIQPVVEGSKFNVTKKMDPEGDGEDAVNVQSGDDNSRVVRKTVKYSIAAGDLGQGLMGGSVNTLVAFPFLHQRDEDQDDGKGYAVDARFSFFLSTEEMSLRTGNNDDLIHMKDKNITTAFDKNGGILHVNAREQSLSPFTKVKEATDAVRRVSNLRLNEGAQACSQLALDGNELLVVTYEWTQTKQGSGGLQGTTSWAPGWSATVWENTDNIVEATCNIRPVKKDGSADPDLNNALSLVKGGYDNGKDIWLNAAVTVRVKKDGRTVDMVPACVMDDRIQNDANLGPLGSGGGGSVAAMLGGWNFPMMRFDTGVKFRLSLKGLNEMSEQKVELSPKGALVSDPRWNHAPEHWFAYDAEINEQAWLQNNRASDGGRDQDDIFLATSDAGYLQSVYELAFLPRLTNLETYGNSSVIGNMDSLQNASLTTIPAGFGNTLNQGLVWREYDPFTDAGRQAFETIPRESAGTGFRINPYSDSTNVLMAAFANTPLDWNRASTNIVEGQDYKESTTAKDFNSKKAFNEYTSGSKLAWEDLEKVASRFRDLTRSSGNWETAWQNMSWSDSGDRFCGIDLSDKSDDLWSVDRKFLYGFWRECFAAKQQLFLIFVRAEPMMMGGESNGQVPPQLGARAMALVWRDPTESKDDKTPHQMRVLFYRQFE